MKPLKELTCSQRERACLKALADASEEHDEGSAFYFRHIAKRTGMVEAKVRGAVRALARKGLAKYERGLFDDGGMVAGSGYSITDSGREWLKIHKV